MIEDAIVNKGVMVYSDNALNTTIDAPKKVNSTTKFLQLAEEEKLYYINPLELGGEPTSITHKYSYLYKDEKRVNYALSSSISYDNNFFNGFSFVGIEVISNPRKSTLDKWALHRDYSYSDRKNLGVIDSNIGTFKINNQKCIVKSSVRENEIYGSRYHCIVYYSQKEYGLTLTFSSPLNEQASLSVFERQCIDMAEIIIGLVKTGQSNYRLGSFYSVSSQDKYVRIKEIDDSRITIDFCGVVDMQEIELLNCEALYTRDENGKINFSLFSDDVKINFVLD